MLGDGTTNLVHPDKLGSQSKMDNNTEAIPWLAYGGTRLDIPDGAALHRELEAATEEDDNHLLSRIGHIIRVRVDESVTDLPANSFAYCTELREIQIHETVTSIGRYAFFLCRSLVTIQIPRHLRLVDSSAFLLCSSLASIWLPDSVVQIGVEAFQGCTALHSLRLPRDITRIPFCAFAECSALATLEIPRSVISIARHAFFRCESLQVIRMSAPFNLLSIGRAAFLDCPSLTEIDVGPMAVNLWPRLLRQLDSPTGLFGNHTCIDQENRTTFVLSFLNKHGAQLCGGGTTGRGRGVIRRTPPVLRN
jgi:hypothetical protein